MAEKITRRFFGGWKGIDNASNCLTRDPLAFIDAQNVRISPSGSIEGRRGNQWAAEVWGFASAGLQYPTYGMGVHKYIDRASGQSKEKLLGVGSHLYELATGQLFMSYSGYGTCQLITRIDPVGGLNEADITIDGVSIGGNFPLALMAANEGNTLETLKDLRNYINGRTTHYYFTVSGITVSPTVGATYTHNSATYTITKTSLTGSAPTISGTLWATKSATFVPLATGTLTKTGGTGDATISFSASANSFVCYLTPAAVVDGAQTGRDLNNAITVFDANTSTAQINTITVSTTEQTRVCTARGVYRDVAASATTAVTIKTIGGTTFNVTNKLEIGVGNCPACSLGYFTQTVGASGATRYFEYWIQIHIPYQTTNIFAPADTKFYTQKNYHFVNTGNKTYISTPFVLSADPRNASRTEAGLVKYDGQSFYQAGMPQQKITSLTAAAPGGGRPGLTGRYRYLARFKYIDTQGSFVFGNESAFSNAIDEVTLATQECQVVVDTIDDTGNTKYFNTNAAVFSNGGTQVGDATTAFTVAYATFNVRVGDWITFLDSSGVRVRVPVTAVGVAAGPLGTIKMGLAASTTIADGTPISAGLTIELYRTKAGGTVYYLLAELTNILSAATITYLDYITDANLGVQYEGLNIGTLRRDLPPPMDNITLHQGLLVGTGIVSGASKDQGNSEVVYFSNAESLEYFPAGINFFNCAGKSSGPLTALASDNANNLIVFKDECYYNATGSLPDLDFTLAEVTNGNIGCPGSHSIRKIDETTFFCSRQGPRAIKDGVLLEDWKSPFDGLFSIIQYKLPGSGTGGDDYTGKKVLHERTTSVYDPIEDLYYIYLNEVGTYSLDGKDKLFSDLILVYSFKDKAWFRDHFLTQWSPGPAAGGAVAYNRNIYTLNYVTEDGLANCRALGLLGKQTRGTGLTTAEFVDGREGALQTFTTQWDYGDDPRQDKIYQNVSVYCAPETIALISAEAFAEHTLTLEIAKNFLWHANKYSVGKTIAASGSSVPIPYDFENSVDKATAMSLRFSTGGSSATLGHRLYVTGWQYDIVSLYEKNKNSFEKK